MAGTNNFKEMKNTMKQIKVLKKLLVTCLLLNTLTGFTQTNTAIVAFKNPSSVSTPKGYAHAAVIDLGNCKMIILSGQVPFDSKGNLIGKGDFTKQAEQVFMNIKNIINDLGGTMGDIVKLGFYMLDVSQIQTLRNVRDKYINLNKPPASTLVQVSKLFRDDVLLEIEATAVIPK